MVSDLLFASLFYQNTSSGHWETALLSAGFHAPKVTTSFPRQVILDYILGREMRRIFRLEMESFRCLTGRVR